MITKLIKPCPFCGGKVEIQIRDAEGNLRDEEYEKDPWSAEEWKEWCLKDE